MKGCYVELYSEQWVSFCLQNCKYNLLLYVIDKVISDFDKFHKLWNWNNSEALVKFLGDLYFNKKQDILE